MPSSYLLNNVYLRCQYFLNFGFAFISAGKLSFLFRFLFLPFLSSEQTIGEVLSTPSSSSISSELELSKSQTSASFVSGTDTGYNKAFFSWLSSCYQMFYLDSSVVYDAAFVVKMYVFGSRVGSLTVEFEMSVLVADMLHFVVYVSKNVIPFIFLKLYSH